MIKKITDLPDNILGFEASGDVTGSDYENVIFPEVEKIRADGKEIRFLFHFGKELGKISLGAMADDTLLGIKYFRHWEKIAIVSDLPWIINSVRVMGMLLPGHVKAYGNDDLTRAIEWLKQ